MDSVIFTRIFFFTKSSRNVKFEQREISPFKNIAKMCSITEYNLMLNFKFTLQMKAMGHLQCLLLFLLVDRTGLCIVGRGKFQNSL